MIRKETLDQFGRKISLHPHNNIITIRIEMINELEGIYHDTEIFNGSYDELYNDEIMDKMDKIVRKVKKWEPEITIEMYQNSEKFALELLKMHKENVSKDELRDFQTHQLSKYTLEMQMYFIERYQEYLEIGELFCDAYSDNPALCNHLAKQYPREVNEVVMNEYRIWNNTKADLYEQWEYYSDLDYSYEKKQSVPTTIDFPTLNSEEEKDYRNNAKKEMKGLDGRSKLVIRRIRYYERMIKLLQIHHTNRPDVDKSALDGIITKDQLKEVLNNYKLKWIISPSGNDSDYDWMD